MALTSADEGMGCGPTQHRLLRAILSVVRARRTSYTVLGLRGDEQMSEQNDCAVDLIAKRVLQAIQEPADWGEGFAVDAEASLYAVAKVGGIVLGAAELRDSEVDILKARFRMAFDRHVDQVRKMKAPSPEHLGRSNEKIVTLSEWAKER